MYFPRQTSPTIAPHGLTGLGLTLSDLAAAITRQEGSCSAPGVCRNNNPGNLRAYAANQPVDSRGIRIFPTYEAGYDALLAQERYNIGRGLTLEEFFGGKPGVYAGYAPPAADSNNPAGYAGNVSNWLGIPRNVPLSELVGGSDVFDLGGTAPEVSGVDSFDWFSSTDGAGTDDLSPAAWASIALAVGVGLWAVA